MISSTYHFVEHTCRWGVGLVPEKLPFSMTCDYGRPMRKSRLRGALGWVVPCLIVSNLIASNLIASNASAEDAKVPPMFAYTYGENETPRSLAMGGAVRAVGNGTTAVFANPANMALSRLYHIEGLGQFTPEVTRALGGATIVDSITSSTQIAGGLSFLGGIIDPSGLGRSLIDARAAAALPIGDRFLLGVGGRYLRLIQDGYGPLDNSVAGTYSVVSGGLLDAGIRKPLVDTVTFDVGATVLLTPALHLGIVGQNLTHPAHGLLPTMVGAGFGYGSEDVSVEADVNVDFDSWGKTTARFMAGGEYLAADHYPLRLGYRFDQGASVHALSAGVGYTGTELAVDLSVRRTLSATVGTTMIAVTIAYHLESSGLTSTRVNDPE